MLSRQEEHGRCVTAHIANSCTGERSLVEHQGLRGSELHSPTGPYLKGKEKYLFPDLQRICSHWTRSRSAESSNLSTMSWKTDAGVNTWSVDLPEDRVSSSVPEPSQRGGHLWLKASDFPLEGDLTHGFPKASLLSTQQSLSCSGNFPLSTPSRQTWLDTSSALPLLSPLREDAPGAPVDTALPACQTCPQHTRPS